ncbi:MAG: nitronate monooxygenase, partial [Flavobacteriales bacterium]|nr:nitronate monooxygenase [Flavobacteriales bacterium]
LVPMVVDAVKIPVIAAGGIATGRAMAAAFALGAEGVQMGSRFVASVESSAHINFKKRVVEAGEGETMLTLKELTPVRLLHNKFYYDVMKAYQQGANKDELAQLLGRGRAKKGMFEGDLEEGELEIGQVSGMINDIKPAAEILQDIISEFNQTTKKMGNIQLT